MECGQERCAVGRIGASQGGQNSDSGWKKNETEAKECGIEK